MKNVPSHDIVEKGLAILANLEHRGAVGADERAGDGVGVLVQIPHKFLKARCAELGFDLPAPHQYAVGHVFMPRDAEGQRIIRETFARVFVEEGLSVSRLARRADRQFDARLFGAADRAAPCAGLHRPRAGWRRHDDDYERRLYVARKRVSNTIFGANDERTKGYYIPSLSCRTLVYKGMFLSDQIGVYYPDLRHPAFE